MLKFGNKEFRNLQEQVKKNMDDILFILQEEGVLNEFGIKVVGQESSVLDMPTVEQYKEDNPDWSFGDAYAIGTEAPYELYILTRANGTHPDDYWFNIGEFPVPGPQGEEGPQGETGPQGPTGPSGQDGVSPQFSIGTVSASTLSAGVSATASVTQTGTYAQPVLNFTFGIPEGQAGSATTTLPWGAITGSIANQTDLVSALQNKANVSTLSSYATQVYVGNEKNDAIYLASLYTDSAISGLSSVYASQSYVTEKIGELNYASVGALSAATFIPSVYGTNDGTNWTDLTINGSTYGFAAGGGNAEWGSISGTLTNQTDLMNKFSEYATISDLSSYATETYVNNNISALSSVYAPIGDYATNTALSNAISGLSSIYATQSSLSNYATVSALSSAVSDINTTIGSLNYASVGALSADTVIPDITGLASETYVNNSISALSSVYASQSALSEYAPISTLSSYATQAWVSGQSYITESDLPVLTLNTSFYASPDYHLRGLAVGSTKYNIWSPNLSEYATQSWVTSNFLSIDTPISVSGAAMLSESNTFASYNRFNGSTRFSGSTLFTGSATFSLNSANFQSRVNFGSDASIFIYASTSTTYPLLYTGRIRAWGNDGPYIYSFPKSEGTIALTSDIPSLSGYATETYVMNQLSSYALSSSLSLYALASDVASMNYASVGALSAATVIPDITGLASEGYVNSAISGLSSVYTTETYVNNQLSSYTPTASLASVALSGDYDDLIDKPDVVIKNELYYKNGDKYKIRNNYNVTGYITSAGKFIALMIQVPKLLTNITSITINKLSLIFRGVGGYVNGNSYIDYSDTTGYTVAAQITEDNVVYIGITSTNGFASATNNTPINCQAVADGIELTFNV